MENLIGTFVFEHTRSPDMSAYQNIIFFYFSTKTYAVGTQTNHLDETVLLSTQNICLNLWVRK